ncbi:hypothetical protein HK104_010025, partial [Borealophlyctis nickersoniae]
MRSALAIGTPKPSKLNPNRVVEVEGKGWWIGPPGCSKDELLDHKSREWFTVMYFHGGGYVIGDPDQDIVYWLRLLEQLAEQKGITNIRVISHRYPLAPEHPYPAAVNAITEAYRDFIKNVPAERLIL